MNMTGLTRGVKMAIANVTYMGAGQMQLTRVMAEDIDNGRVMMVAVPLGKSIGIAMRQNDGDDHLDIIGTTDDLRYILDQVENLTQWMRPTSTDDINTMQAFRELTNTAPPLFTDEEKRETAFALQHIAHDNRDNHLGKLLTNVIRKLEK